MKKRKRKKQGRITCGWCNPDRDGTYQVNHFQHPACEQEIVISLFNQCMECHVYNPVGMPEGGRIILPINYCPICGRKYQRNGRKFYDKNSKK